MISTRTSVALGATAQNKKIAAQIGIGSAVCLNWFFYLSLHSIRSALAAVMWSELVPDVRHTLTREQVRRYPLHFKTSPTTQMATQEKPQVLKFGRAELESKTQ